MYHRIEIKYKPDFHDGREKNIIEVVKEDAEIKLDNVKIIDVYNLFGDFTNNEIIKLK